MQDKINKPVRTGVEYTEVPGDEAELLRRALQMISEQIRISAEDSRTSVSEMLDAITSLVRITRNGALDKQSPDCSSAVDSTECETRRHIHQAVVASQFHDLLEQRITHICDTLDDISACLGACNTSRAAMWNNLLRRMQSVYSTDQVQRIYRNAHGNAESGDRGKQAPGNIPARENADTELF